MSLDKENAGLSGAGTFQENRTENAAAATNQESNAAREYAVAVRRRKQAAFRLAPIPDSADPWVPRPREHCRDGELDAWRDAQRHLQPTGYPGIAPKSVEQALRRRDRPCPCCRGGDHR